jgi:hypothetical protein
MLVLGAVHAFANGTCSTTGYSRFGPVPHCAKGIGWWAGMLILGIFVGLAGGVLFAHRDMRTAPVSVVAAVLAGAIGVAGAFGIAAGIKSAIGKVTTPSTTIVGGSGVGTLSAAQVRANKVSVCKGLVAAQRLISASVKSSLTAECQTGPAAAQKRLAVEAKAAAIAYATTQCKNAAGGSGLPASAQQTLSTQCGDSAKSGGTASTAATAAKLCQEIVKAQVPPAAQPQALAECPKP